MAKKITTDEKIKIAQAIVELAIKITDNTEHDVFVSYSAHVDWIDVNIHVGGWRNSDVCKNSTINFAQYNDWRSDYRALLRFLHTLLPTAAKEMSR